MSGFFEFLLSFFQIQTEYFTGEIDWVSTVMIWFLGVVLIGFIVVLSFAVCYLVWRKAAWLFKRERCQHDACGHAWTVEVAEDEYPRCVMGLPCCDSCLKDHEDAAVQQRANLEPRRDCVRGHGPMNKVVVSVLDGHAIIDKCGDCRGVWLDRAELDKLEAAAQNSGYASGHRDGSATSGSNLALGIVIGSAI